MAVSVRVEFYVVAQGVPVLIIEPRWWDPEDICKDRRFMRTNDTGSYDDWDADLTEDEFRAMHERFRSKAYEGVFSAKDWRPKIDAQLALLDGALGGGLGTISKVHVTAFEWESGY